MPLFGSSSKTTKTYATENSDERIIADGDSTAINSGGGAVHIVADEAFELAELALMEQSTFARDALDANTVALSKALSAARTESAQLGEMAIKIGLPVLALIYIFGGGLGK